MIIDVTELMNHRSERINFDYTFDTEHADCEIVDLPDDVRIKDNGIHVVGSAYDTLGRLVFSAHVTAEFSTNCARCLDETTDSIEFDIERTILNGQPDTSFYDRHVGSDNEWDGITDDFLYANESKIIPDYDIVTEISLELPALSLCSPDCPGLCPRCGKKLSDGACDCKEEKYINPNFAILKKLLDNQE